MPTQTGARTRTRATERRPVDPADLVGVLVHQDLVTLDRPTTRQNPSARRSVGRPDHRLDAVELVCDAERGRLFRGRSQWLHGSGLSRP